MPSRRTTRRLPGFRFETQAPPLTEWLPRMDVACFVGFAAAGPLDTPVAVESVAHFNAIFGADAVLAWDGVRGEQVSAYLAPCVRAFFANGGLRCWVVRVARRFSLANKFNRARYNYFPLPGLAMATLDARGQINKLNPAFARARSEGSWSDALEASAALLSRSVEVVGMALDKLEVDLAIDTPDDIGNGDLLRFTFVEGDVLLCYVGAVARISPSTAEARARVRVKAAQAVWLQTRAPANQPTVATQVKLRLFNFEPLMRPFVKPNYDEEQTVVDRFLIRYDATLQPIVNDDEARGGQTVALDLDVAPVDAPAPGSLVAIDLPTGGQIWVTVEQSSITSHGATSAGTGVRVTGQGVWWTGRAPDVLPATISAAEKLSFELWVRQAGAYMLSVGDLAFHPEHPRCWTQLPTDRAAYKYDETAPVEAPAADLWRPVGDVLRFPLAAAPVAGDAIYLPLAVPAVPDPFLGAVRLTGSTLERDGLAEFDAGLFLDPNLLDATVEDLNSRADFLRYLAPAPRQLSGIHAALGIEEVTLISVPDAVQRGWTKTDPDKAPPAAPSLPLPRPAWWRFNCALHDEPPLVAAPPVEHFLDCGLRVVAPPVLETSTELTPTGTFTLTWTATEPDAQFILEEANALDAQGQITGAREIYTGPLKRFTLYGRRDGDYYYRVRIVAADGNTSDWSNSVAVRVAAVGAWLAVAESVYDNSALIAVQRALLRLAAARADLLAVLTLPDHYREDKTLEHVALLKRIAGDFRHGTELPDATTLEGVPPFNGGEPQVFSYGALYHPWLIGDAAQEQLALRRVPPDGAACGVLAQRALTRGAWIAPANEALHGVVALTPQVQRERLLDLQDAQLNIVRQEARGFLVMNADTLSDDESLRLINVRRLLILLRRLALRHGATYVFEPNSDAFRRSVERGFESLLDLLFARGAFAGATAATSYQVNAGDTMNPPQSVEQGRFIVELRVAPSEPMTFMTIRLVQTGGRAEVTEVR